MQTTPSDVVSGYTNRTAYENQFWVDLVDDVSSYGAGGYLDHFAGCFPNTVLSSLALELPHRIRKIGIWQSTATDKLTLFGDCTPVSA